MSYYCKCRLNDEKCNWKWNWNDDKCRFECKKILKKHGCERDYVWNPSLSAFKCDKKCEIDLYVNNCTFRKPVFDNLLITCDDSYKCRICH